MNIKKLFGVIGASVAAFGGLVLAGKSGFGENLFTKKEEPVDDEFDDVIAADDETEEEVVLEDLDDES